MIDRKVPENFSPTDAVRVISEYDASLSEFITLLQVHKLLSRNIKQSPQSQCHFCIDRAFASYKAIDRRGVCVEDRCQNLLSPAPFVKEGLNQLAWSLEFQPHLLIAIYVIHIAL